MDAISGARAVALGGSRPEHWAAAYVLAGLRWQNGGQGPQAYDCWSFFRLVQLERFGREVPIVKVEGELDTLAGRVAWKRRVLEMFLSHPERARWQQVAAPLEGDAVLMRRAQDPSHIGVWIDADGGGVLHCVRELGPCFDRVIGLRLSGWNAVEFWRGP